MKKRIFFAGVLVAIITAIAGWNFNQKNETTLSELGLANVEALARGESGNCRCEPFTSAVCVANGRIMRDMIEICD